jgi:hypothetical protein
MTGSYSFSALHWQLYSHYAIERYAPPIVPGSRYPAISEIRSPTTRPL